MFGNRKLMIALDNHKLISYSRDQIKDFVLFANVVIQGEISKRRIFYFNSFNGFTTQMIYHDSTKRNADHEKKTGEET